MELTCSEKLALPSNGVVSSISYGECAIITEDVYSFKSGTDQDWTSKPASGYIKFFDFSRAVNLESIGSYTFYKCSSVQSFDLSSCKKLNSIGICAFRECTSAISIILPKDSRRVFLQMLISSNIRNPGNN